MSRRLALTHALALGLVAWLPLASPPVAAQGASATGEVTRVDKAAGRVSIKHGEIPALDMPAMTMAYRVRDPRLLDSVSVGDKVRFTAERIDGSFTVTQISRGS